MAHWGFKLCDDVRLKLAVGPYVAVGIGGRTHAYVSSSKYNIDEETGVGQYEYRNDYYRFGTFKGKAVNEEFGFEASPRLDWGGTASVGIAVKRISFTIGYDLAWGKYNKEQNDLRIRNHMVSFISGYTFDKKRINETNIHKISCLRLLNEEFCVCLFFINTIKVQSMRKMLFITLLMGGLCTTVSVAKAQERLPEYLQAEKYTQEN